MRPVGTSNSFGIRVDGLDFLSTTIEQVGDRIPQELDRRKTASAIPTDPVLRLSHREFPHA